MRDARRRACLEAMGIERWRLDPARPALQRTPAAGAGAAPADDLPQPAAPVHEAAHGPAEAGASMSPAAAVTLREPVDGYDWPALGAAAAGCRACGLHATRTQVVFGVGDPAARLMIVGEAPGADEDRQGEPFVGRAGQLLNAMLAAIGLAREQVYIANIIKCRPPGNRDPHAEEAAACRPFLQRQIALVGPSLILSVGRISAHNLLGTEESVGRLRGRVHRIDPGEIPLVVTYHPAYLLRRPTEKAKAWQDLQAAYRLLRAG